MWITNFFRRILLAFTGSETSLEGQINCESIASVLEKSRRRPGKASLRLSQWSDRKLRSSVLSRQRYRPNNIPPAVHGGNRAKTVVNLKSKIATTNLTEKILSIQLEQKLFDSHLKNNKSATDLKLEIPNTLLKAKIPKSKLKRGIATRSPPRNVSAMIPSPNYARVPIVIKRPKIANSISLPAKRTISASIIHRNSLLNGVNKDLKIWSNSYQSRRRLASSATTAFKVKKPGRPPRTIKKQLRLKKLPTTSSLSSVFLVDRANVVSTKSPATSASVFRDTRYRRQLKVTKDKRESLEQTIAYNADGVC